MDENPFDAAATVLYINRNLNNSYKNIYKYNKDLNLYKLI